MSLRDRQQLAVIGTGLLGASVAAAARRTRQWTVVGFDSDPQALKEAQGRGYIDRPADSVASAVEGAAVVMLAVPVRAAPELMREFAPALRDQAIVTDVLSTKASIGRAARELLPSPGRFVGAHPMAGSEKDGPGAARLDLFQGRRCFVVPAEDASATRTVSEMWRSFGARVETIDAESHDRLVAAMSHVPQVVASALAGMLTEEEMAAGGNGLRDTTRIAASDPGIWVDILLDNQRAVGEALGRFRARLDELERGLGAGDAEAVRTFLEAGASRRRGSEGT